MIKISGCVDNKKIPIKNAFFKKVKRKKNKKSF